MRTKKRKAEVGNLPGFRKTIEEVAEQEAKETREELDADAASSYRPGSKLQIPLNDDGSIDLKSMRESSKEKIRAAISSTPDLAANAPQATIQAQVFHPSMVAGMYAMLGAVEAMALSRIFKVPEPVAKQVFSYTPAEVELLTPPTVRVLNKYATEWMIKYQDEIALAGLLISMTIAKVNSALLLSKVQNANTAPNGSQAKSDKDPQNNGGEPTGPIQ